jgi:hydrogenase maturation protease
MDRSPTKSGGADGAADAPGGTLVLAWGNELRGDDGAGPRVGTLVRAMGRPGCRVIVAHQLTPELSRDAAGCARVVFVDADAEATAVRVERMLAAPDAGGGLGHTGGPAQVLELARQLYGREPEAWLVRVPAREFELGRPLSAATEAAAREAARRIRDLMTDAEGQAEP